MGEGWKCGMMVKQYSGRFRLNMTNIESHQKTKPYACSYFHDQARWALTIHAYSWSDAEARCRKLGLQLDGRFLATVPTRIGLLARIICAIRNFLRCGPTADELIRQGREESDPCE